MRRWTGLLMAFAAMTISAPVRGEEKKSGDDAAVGATAAEFVRAFNKGDAPAIGVLWDADAVYTDEGGREFKGRAAIEAEYAGFFKEHPGAIMTVSIDSIRFVGPDLAIEKGVARVKSPDGDADSAARYTVLHARRGGRWMMVDGRDTPLVAPSGGEGLKELEWLIGDWSAASKDRRIRARFEWMAGRNFIRCTTSRNDGDQPAEASVQIIGWNPRLGRIASWQFDEHGGFGDAVWSRDGAKWVIEAASVLPDGRESTAINILSPAGKNTVEWSSIERTLEGAELPDVPPIRLERVSAEK